MKKQVICCSWNSENRDFYSIFPNVVLNFLKEWCPGDYEKIYPLQMQTNTLILPSEDGRFNYLAFIWKIHFTEFFKGQRVYFIVNK